MAIYIEFSHKKNVIFHSYVGLPEGILLEHGLCFNAWRPGMAQIACAGMVLHGMAWYGMVWHGMAWYGCVGKPSQMKPD